MRNRWVISWLVIDYWQWSMRNRWVISWSVIDYWLWSMSNRWVIETQKFCGLSTTHPWSTSITHWSRTKDTLLAFLYNLFSFVILIYVRRIFPCIWSSCWRNRDAKVLITNTDNSQLRNLQNWTTLTGQLSRCGSTTNGKEMLEGLLKLLKFPCTTYAEKNKHGKNKPGNICLQIRLGHEMISMSNGWNQWVINAIND